MEFLMEIATALLSVLCLAILAFFLLVPSLVLGGGIYQWLRFRGRLRRIKRELDALQQELAAIRSQLGSEKATRLENALQTLKESYTFLDGQLNGEIAASFSGLAELQTWANKTLLAIEKIREEFGGSVSTT
jgi:uncharacterized protein HemX